MGLASEDTPIIQIAGVHDLEEATMLEELGVQFIGFPLVLDVHPQDCSLEEAKGIIAALKQETHAVLITYESRPDELTRLMEYLGTSWVQIHGHIDLQGLKEFREKCPTCKIIKSLVVGLNTQRLIENAQAMEPFVDYFLTDTFDPVSGASGATGKTHDWTISRKLAQELKKPLILAGGLTAENVERAIETVKPFGVDSHTGVEGKDGRKDPKQVHQFMKRAMTAFHRTKGFLNN